MVSEPNPLLQRLTTMSLINKIPTRYDLFVYTHTRVDTSRGPGHLNFPFF